MKYIDISEHQGDFDFSKAKVDGVILRAGHGKTPDIKFERNVEACPFPIGVYWYSEATNVEDAKKEAAQCLAAIKGKKIELPIAYDLEYYTIEHFFKPRGIEPTKRLCTDMALAFLDAIEKAGYYAMLYSSPNFISTYYYEEELKRFDLWLAQYPYGQKVDPKIDLSTPPRSCGIWQWGLTRIGNMDVDADEAYHDYAQIVRVNDLNHLYNTYSDGDDTIYEPVNSNPQKPNLYSEALKWAKNIGLEIQNPNEPATKADVVWMFYEYHKRFGPEDDKPLGGAVTD